MWNNLFNPENSFWSFMAKIADIFYVSLIFLFFSLPLITIGASITALLSFTLKQSENRDGYIFKTFLNAFKMNFKQSTVVYLLTVLLCSFFFLDYYALFTFTFPQIFKVLTFSAVTFLVIVSIMIIIYIFPLIAYYRVSVKKAIKDSLYLAINNIGSTVFIMLVYTFVSYLCYRYTLFSFLFVALGFFAVSPIFSRIFRKIDEVPET